MFYKHNYDIIASEEQPQGYVEITEEEYNRILGIHQQITELKFQLKKTDYKAIKHSEGCYTEEEYAPVKEHRQALRDAINELLNNI